MLFCSHDAAPAAERDDHRPRHTHHPRRDPRALPREDRPHHAGLDGPVRRAARRQGHGARDQQGRARRASASALADVEGRPFWTTFWWQVSRRDQPGHSRRASARAAQGRVRPLGHAEIYGRAGGTETIIIDASLMPVKDERRRGRLPRLRGPRHHREEGLRAGDRPAARGAGRSSTSSRRSSSPTSATSSAPR